MKSGARTVTSLPVASVVQSWYLPVAVLRADEPALLLNASATAISALPLPEALICAPDATVISEPAVVPSLRIMTVLPEIEAFVPRLISPDDRFVLPVPSFNMITTLPAPAAKFLDAPREMTASPESRIPLTTPLAVVSLA